MEKEFCMKKPAIEFKDFSFQYRAQAKPTLNNINLTIYIVPSTFSYYIYHDEARKRIT